jgi:hypothetical protein
MNFEKPKKELTPGPLGHAKFDNERGIWVKKESGETVNESDLKEKYAVKDTSNEQSDAFLLEQQNLAREYLARYRKFEEHNSKTMSALRLLDSLRDESDGSETSKKEIEEQEREFRRLSLRSDALLNDYTSLSDKMTDATKEKYLK